MRSSVSESEKVPARIWDRYESFPVGRVKPPPPPQGEKERHKFVSL